ncbi:DUF1295-domain-containing protein [Auriculariales sp. MPI-PUGE-AT-0066]|nr:DUF1295-domain-containing protein [Auriculariales sp. MPI-PUGE-AT-0066]
MTATHVLDGYYLGITALITVGYQLLGFAVAWTFKFDKVTDLTGGSNFFLLALFTLLAGDRTSDTRSLVVSILVMIWAVRIAGFLFLRVLVTGSDTRFDSIRSHFWSFMGFWIGQMLWVWIVSLPVTILNSPKSASVDGHSHPDFGTGRDIAGVVIWGLGWLIETYADIHKFIWKQTHKGKQTAPMQSGLWAWSRHPPYFGEILCWWGIWTIVMSPAVARILPSGARVALIVSVVSPLFTTILLVFGSGIPTAEKPMAQRYYLMTHGPKASPEDADVWPAYKSYLKSTSLLVPIPRALYRPMPAWLKRYLLLDLPFFNFDEKTDGPRVIEEEKKKAS